MYSKSTTKTLPLPRNWESFLNNPVQMITGHPDSLGRQVVRLGLCYIIPHEITGNGMRNLNPFIPKFKMKNFSKTVNWAKLKKTVKYCSTAFQRMVTLQGSFKTRKPFRQLRVKAFSHLSLTRCVVAAPPLQCW